MQLLISSAMLADLQQLALAAAPHEICGILFGRQGRVSARRATKNVADDPHRHFEIDPRALIAAERDQRSGGEPILGYYHSHPSGTVRPSIVDAESAAPDGRLWLIVNGHDAAAWLAVKNGEIYGRFDAIPLDCFGANGQTAAE
ncbi:M67 family metallopeptidase [Parasphingorhabdus sp.]|uniref:M67 family metallopeptidase n=2 Tax=Parasphingorhabdus sp. TaxID=2709688 RepID=UPI002B26D13F|nr:M67 family metallopeptidase [Parasphingorhabdus sp.]